ncbi:hypothetical protein GGS23DRAFT_591830 [Durotheca rogersii]|uniref:uncharacterized protein n=1 Tax=Durotheca rogersii TaxID=419775 RepID=UPI00221EA618|nr:uncharacterized protein GGS23DRAFT_591830 [Durotheca rogersii]KAI5868029.1 hypothetical protein GGS23DRAFT_591830 [Durotheca rogersii]
MATSGSSSGPRKTDIKTENKTENKSSRPTPKYSRNKTSSPIPVNQPQPQPPSTAPNNPHRGHADGQDSPSSTYQQPGPGFEHTVSNIPGLGLRYKLSGHTNVSAAPGVFGGLNPSSVQREQLRQVPNLGPPAAQVPVFLPPSVPAEQQPAMAYTYPPVPNQAQSFQPPVPDTSLGEIPHTYHPRFDDSRGQFVTINGQLYQVVAGPPGGPPVQYVLHQVSPAPQDSQFYLQGTQPPQPLAPPQLPFLIPTQPGVGQPAAIFTQPGAVPDMRMGGAAFPGVCPVGNPPDVTGIGRTRGEVQMEQLHTALNNKALEGQGMAPADPDPSRMYYCREIDGEWILRNRFSIDHMGEFRWFVLPGGVFYAVRLAD